MRPGTTRAYALGVLTGSVVTSLMCVFAAPAKADVSEDEASMYYGPVCATLAEYPSVNGVIGIGLALKDEGYSGYEAGQILGLSVINQCPQFIPILRAFAAQYAPQQVA
jgi:hypothetical protein